MAQRSCIRNIAGLQDVGDISYELARPVLKKIDNPDQLIAIEAASPHIADADAELWKAFIARDIPQWQEKIVEVEPSNPRSWHRSYKKLVRQEQRDKAKQEAQLKAAMLGINKQKEANQTQIIQRVIPEKARSNAAFVDGVRNPRANGWGQVKTPTLQNAKKGKDILSALKKQSSSAQQQRGFSKIQPAKAMLPGAKSQIKQAPEGMVRDYVKPRPTATAGQQGPENASVSRTVPRVFVSRSGPSAQDKAVKEVLREEQAKKEDRLRALTGAKPKASPASSPPAVSSRPASTTAAPPAGEAVSPVTVPTATPPKRAPAASAMADEMRKNLSPSPTPSSVAKRPRPAGSIFMPSKKKKI